MKKGVCISHLSDSQIRSEFCREMIGKETLYTQSQALAHTLLIAHRLHKQVLRGKSEPSGVTLRSYLIKKFYHF